MCDGSFLTRSSNARRLFLFGGRTFVRTCLVALALLALLGARDRASAASNKLVGVVFDDSGSMENRTNLPVFGIQVLAGSLSRNDQLYGLTFSQFRRNGFDANALRDPARLRQYLTRFSLGGPTEQQSSINAIRDWAKKAEDGTPLLPVLGMLAFLTAIATPDDDVHFFVFTDGGFNGPIIDKSTLTPLLNTLKQSSRARSIAVHFLAFVADSNEEATIRSQGIADLLDQTFNPAGSSGLFYAKSFDSLRSQLVEVIARIADAEPEDTQKKSATVTRSGNSITVSAPFTVTKIVVVSTAPDRSGLPVIKTLPPEAPSTPTEFLAAMEGTDSPQKLPGTDGRRWYARITHIDPHPALPANKQFALEFDRPLTNQTTMLFRTDITVEWEIVDGTGQPVAPDANGVVNLAADQDYEIRAHIVDRNAGAGPAPLQGLPQETEFTTIRRDSSQRVTRDRMQIDKTNNRAVSKLHYTQPLTDELSVSIAMPGFVTARSRNVKINVVRTSIDVNLTVKPLVQCANCSPSKVEPQLSPSMPWTPVMSVTANFLPRGQIRDGTVAFALVDPLPDGLRAKVVGSNELLEGTRTKVEMPFKAGTPIELQFEVDANFLRTLPNGYKAKLSATTLPPVIGSGGAIFEIKPRPEDAQLEFAGTTDGATGATPLRIKPDAVGGTAGFYVRVLRPFAAPKPADFDIRIAGLAADVIQQPQQDIMLVKPRARTCACFVMSGRYDIAASFQNASGQKANVAGYMIVEEVTPWERFLLCLWQIIGTLLALYLLWGLYRLAKSRRFPRRSRLLVYPTGQRIEGIPKKLARRPWPWVLPFVAPFMRWNERRRIEGLNLEAGSGGVLLLPRRSGGYDHLRRGNEHRPVAHHFEDGSKQPLEIFWGERLEELGGERRTFEFVESTSSI